jgi:tRNA nucleotidyltransferase (CCA-adding enzyme)
MFAVLDHCGASADLIAGVLPPAGVMACAVKNQFPLPVRVALWLSHCNELQVTVLAKQLRFPVDCRDLALLLVRQSQALKHPDTLSAEGRLDLIEQCDALRRPERFKQLLSTLRCLGVDQATLDTWLKIQAAAAGVDAGAIALSVRTQAHIPARIRDARIEAIQSVN